MWCLRSFVAKSAPQYACGLRHHFYCVATIELDHHIDGAFLCARGKFPLLDGFHGGLSEDRAAASDGYVFDTPVRGDAYLKANDSADSHSAEDRRIVRDDSLYRLQTRVHGLCM
jgi:hypothetical protein